MADIKILPPGGNFNPPAPTAPPQGPGAAAQGIGRVAAEMEDKAESLGRHLAYMDRANQFSLANSEFVDRMDELVRGPNGVLLNPKLRADPNAAREAVLTQAQAISRDVLSKYPSADHDGLLSRNMTIRAASYARGVFGHALANQEQAVKEGADAAAAAAVNTALNASDPRDRQIAVNDYVTLLQHHVEHGLFTPEEAELRKQKFNQQLDMGGLQKLIAANPSMAVTELHSPDFTERHRFITPQQRLELQTRADTALAEPARLAEAQFRNLRGNLLEQLYNKAASNTLSGADLQRAYESGISRDDLRALAPGFTPSEASDPAALSHLRQAITEAPLELNVEDIHAAVASHTISATDAPQLLADLRRNQKQAHDYVGGIALTMWPRLQQELTKAPDIAAMPGEREEYRRHLQQMHDDWIALTRDATRPEDVYNAADRLRQMYGPKAAARAAKFPPKLPGEKNSDWIARGRALGFKHEDALR